MPTVSINLCCYNSEKYLRETLDSIVKQTYPDWELIIINDGSKDSTEAIVKEYIGQGYPIVYHYQENRGLGYSRNEALARSSGEYIAFIDHDDVWLPGKLARQAAVFKSDPDVDFVYTNYYFIKNGKKTIRLKGRQPEGSVFGEFLGYYPVHVSTVAVKKSALNRLTSLFSPQFIMVEEYDLFMRLLLKSKAKYIDEPLATYRYHSQMSSVVQEIRLIRESMIVLEQFKSSIPEIKGQYAAIIDKLEKRNKLALAFKSAKDALVTAGAKKARRLIGPYKLANIRLFVFYLLTLFPSAVARRLWLLILKIKDLVGYDK